MFDGADSYLSARLYHLFGKFTRPALGGQWTWVYLFHGLVTTFAKRLPAWVHSAPATFPDFSHSFALCKSLFRRKTPNLGKSMKGAQHGQSPVGVWPPIWRHGPELGTKWMCSMLTGEIVWREVVQSIAFSYPVKIKWGGFLAIDSPLHRSYRNQRTTLNLVLDECPRLWDPTNTVAYRHGSLESTSPEQPYYRQAKLVNLRTILSTEALLWRNPRLAYHPSWR